VRCAVELSASCLKCLQPFVKEGETAKTQDVDIQDVSIKVATPATSETPSLASWPFPNVLLAPEVQDA
jgi:hypothetical protein